MSILGESLRAFSDSRERYWWQSRHNLRDPPQLADLHTLARSIRQTVVVQYAQVS